MEVSNKICPSCKSAFECLHNIDCWCMKYTISEQNRAYIAMHYTDCLCENCLKKFAQFQDTSTEKS